MSWNLLERFINSDHFNRDPSFTVAYLARYADHVGIQYVLSNKLRQFSYEEIEFFLPQLCHLLLSLDNESMALEEFIVDLCEESVNAALLSFWLLQAYLKDFAASPTSNVFKKCRRIFNRVQRIVFGGGEPVRRERIKENILPTTVLASIILAGVGVPLFPQLAGPLAISQARKPRPVEDTISENVQTQKPSRSHTVSGTSHRPRRPRTAGADGEAAPERSSRSNGKSIGLSVEVPRLQGSETPHDAKAMTPKSARALLNTPASDGYGSSSSLPDAQSPRTPGLQSPLSRTTAVETRRPKEVQRRHSHSNRATTPAGLSTRQKVRILRSHYFRLESQFLTALEDISNRLVAVPKPARLSALRAELALISEDLPAEVDIPLICPPTLEDGTASKSKHHRVVRLNPAEATSLNSAERVPYLLMIEVLREDFDFDPDTQPNNEIIATVLAEKGKTKRRRFDITDSHRLNMKSPEEAGAQDSVFEPSLGDLASPQLLRRTEEEQKVYSATTPSSDVALREPPRLSAGVSTISSNSLVTPRTSGQALSRAGSPGRQHRNSGQGSRSHGMDPDVKALATHMRAASQMLAQLETSSSKRPKAEVAVIRAKIIASMQSLEEQSFWVDDGPSTPSFNDMVENANTIGSHASPEDVEDTVSESAAEIDPNLSSGAGAARMENDIKTGGVALKTGDREDPSAATFGEAWEVKRERIRRSSPYGWMPNWDLVSVIVKTGADLRQEAFATQLIAVCAKTWAEAEVDVWVKHMRILVTGESSGLIETITNGVSLHSLKRSLTLASISAGSNPRKRIATLRDHFIRTFGDPASAPHVAAAEAFAKSLAAYSVISYILQLKDRHNGNILIDDRGHIVHIDFGFMLSNSPGSMGFEAAPFKLTAEYVEVLGGPDGDAYKLFARRMREAFLALRREAEPLVMLVDLMGRESRMSCYSGGVANVVAALRGRFVLERSEREAEVYVDELVAKSAGSYYTRLYDTFQYRTQGIY